MIRNVVITVCVLALVILACGYRHAATHGSLYVSLTNFSVKDHPRSIHVGGKPYTYLGMSINVDAARCVSVTRN